METVQTTDGPFEESTPNSSQTKLVDIWAFLATKTYPIDSKEVKEAMEEMGFNNLIDAQRRVFGRLTRSLKHPFADTEFTWEINLHVNCAEKHINATFYTNYASVPFFMNQGFESVNEMIQIICRNGTYNWVFNIPEETPAS